MRKVLRVCVEARDVFASRALRMRGGLSLGALQEMEISMTTGSAIMAAGLVSVADFDAFRDGCAVVDGCLQALPEARRRLADAIRSRFQAAEPGPGRQEMLILESVLDAVVDLFGEVVMIEMVNRVMVSSRFYKVPHERHWPRLSRFFGRMEARYYRSVVSGGTDAVLDALDRRVATLRKAARWLRDHPKAVVDGVSSVNAFGVGDSLSDCDG